jgi:DNA-binding CsgD family transcriptional regulator
VEALAWLGHLETWHGNRDGAVDLIEEAGRVARAVGSARALAWALCTRSFVRDDPERNLAQALRAHELALEVGDPMLIGVTGNAANNCHEGQGRRREAAELRLATYRWLRERGSIHDAMWAGPQSALADLLDLGRWDEVRDVLRELLSCRHSPAEGAQVRGIAAQLAYRSGDADAGRAHLARARELVPGPWGVGDVLSYVESEALWADGEPREALACAVRQVPEWCRVAWDGADQVVAFAARAAADLAERPGCRDEARALLEQVEDLRGVEPPLFTPAGPADVLHPAYGALFAAERTRCRGDPHPAPTWRSAVAACHRAGLVWDEALSAYQLARALLAERGSRGEAASALRRAWHIATTLGAAPILHDVETLARQAHLPLAEPDPTPVAPDGVPGLTPREREVLSHLVAGRTYAEIAHALVISEKTVSVHVSNLLRKTGTSSRIELAELATRSS